MHAFRDVAHSMSATHLGKTFRASLMSTRSSLQPQDLQHCLHSLVSSPQFHFDLSFLSLALNKDMPALAYSLLLAHKEAITRKMEASLEHSEQVWTALGESLENGLSL